MDEDDPIVEEVIKKFLKLSRIFITFPHFFLDTRFSFKKFKFRFACDTISY